MALAITPQSYLEAVVKGEEIAYTLDATDELGSNTVKSHTYKVYDDDGTDVTANFGGGSSASSGVITFGLIAYDTGSYSLEFIITCNEMLPDGTTENEFYVKLTVEVE